MANQRKNKATEALNFLFASSIPAELQSSDNSAVLKALESTGMTGVKFEEPSADFGKKVLVAGTPSLPVGTAFMLLRPTRVNAKNRDGVDVSYDAFIILLETGEERAVAVTALFNHWLPKYDDMTEKQQAMFEGYDKSIDAINAFYKKNNKSSILNSPVNDYTIELPFQDRINAFNGVVTTVDSVQFDFKFVDKKTQKEGTGRQRLTAFSASDDDADIQEFISKVKEARKG